MCSGHHNPCNGACDVPTLTVTFGIPGSGKSTWATANAGNSLVLSADILRTDRTMNTARYLATMKAQALAALRQGRDVTVDICATNPKHRAQWLTLARWTKARTRIVLFATPHTVALERNAARTHAVPAEDMARYIRDFDTALTALQSEPWDEAVAVGVTT
jgi:predicted kinase